MIYGDVWGNRLNQNQVKKLLKHLKISYTNEDTPKECKVQGKEYFIIHFKKPMQKYNINYYNTYNIKKVP